MTDRNYILQIPDDDVSSPDVSIVIPAMNERLTIQKFVSWCHEGLKNAGVSGEILIVDSSTDETANLALASGARVLRVPKNGLGQAYKDAIPYIRGKWVIMGDADCTYDFRNLVPFIRGFQDGYEFVMGSRWLGSIEKGSMPVHHRYFGTPLTTWVLNRLYHSHFSDIHCGMRGITLEGLQRIRLSSSSWEYASEMVLKSVHYNLSTVEVPVAFYADQPGRLSHHKRSGWLSPFLAAWINLRAMFTYGADFFLVKPGVFLSLIGTLGVLSLSLGPVRIGSVEFSLYWMLLFNFTGLLGTQSLLLGLIARCIYDVAGQYTQRLSVILDYTKITILGFTLIFLGIMLCTPLLNQYIDNGFSDVTKINIDHHLAVLGLYCSTSGFSLFICMLIVRAITARLQEAQANG